MRYFISLLFIYYLFGYNYYGDMMIYGWLVFSSFLWGSNVLVMKYMLENTSTYFLATLKVLLSVIVLFAIMKYKKIPVSFKNIGLGFKVSLLSITLNFILTFEGLGLMSGSANAIVNSLAPLITVLLAMILYHTKINRYQLIAVVIACFGFFISLNFDLCSISFGHLLMIGGIVLYSYGNLLIQYNCKVDDRIPFTFQYLCLSFIQLFIIALIVPRENNIANISMMLWLLFIFFSGIGFAIIQLVYFRAVHEIGSIKTSFILGLNPLFTYIGSLLLGESFSLNKLIAMGVMIIALVIANKK